MTFSGPLVDGSTTMQPRTRTSKWWHKSLWIKLWVYYYSFQPISTPMNYPRHLFRCEVRVCVCAIIEYYQCLSDGWVNENPRCLKQDYLSHTLFTFYIIYTNTAPLWSLATQKLVENLGSVFLMQYKVWPLVNYFVFKFVPERMRVLTSNIVSVFWNAYLCTRLA